MKKMTMMQMNKFKEITKKNFILLWRSKNAILTIFFGPLILIFLLGLAFNNTGLNRLSVASYSEQYSNFSNSLLERLEKNDFILFKTQNEQECIDNVKLGKNHVCLIIPVDFDIDKNNELIVYIDKSKVNLVGNLINILSYNIEDRSSELSLNLTEILVDRLNKVGLLNLEDSEFVDELKSINIYSLTSVEKMAHDLNELNSTISELIFKINELKEKNQQGSDSGDTVSQVSGIADESINLVGSIRSKADASLLPDLNDLDSWLNKLKNKLSGSAIFDAAYWNELELIINNLDSNSANINKIKTQLSNNLVLVKHGLNTGTVNINNLQINLGKINSDVSSIKIKDATKIVNPIVTDLRPIVPEKSYLNYVFPTLLVLIIMFGGVLLSSTASIVEKKDRAFFRNFISPTSNFIFLVTRYITDFIIVLFQLILFLGISLIFLGIGIFSNFSTFIMLLIIISFFILLGIFIGGVFNSEESGVLFSLIITSIMLFFSNTILPIENMAGFVYRLSRFNPFVLSEIALRKSIVYGLGINLILKEVLFLFIWIAVIVLAIFIVTKLNTKQIIEGIKNIIFVEEE